MTSSIAILLAAGRSSRMQGAVEDKVLEPLAGRTVFEYSLAAFKESGAIDAYVIVYRDLGQKKSLESILQNLELEAPVKWAEGGAQRRDSVYSALHLIEPNYEYVFVHDCARPLIRPWHITQLQAQVSNFSAAALAAPVVDTISEIRGQLGTEGSSVELNSLERDSLLSMQTPQAFSCSLLKKAYDYAFSQGLAITDEASAIAQVGHSISIVKNKEPNIKLTHSVDFKMVSMLLTERKEICV